VEAAIETETGCWAVAAWRAATELIAVLVKVATPTEEALAALYVQVPSVAV